MWILLAVACFLAAGIFAAVVLMGAVIDGRRQTLREHGQRPTTAQDGSVRALRTGTEGRGADDGTGGDAEAPGERQDD